MVSHVLWNIPLAPFARGRVYFSLYIWNSGKSFIILSKNKECFSIFLLLQIKFNAFILRERASCENSPSLFFYTPMQEVTPKVVAIAVNTVMTMFRILLQRLLFMMFDL